MFFSARWHLTTLRGENPFVPTFSRASGPRRRWDQLVCTETSLPNYRSTLSNISEEHRTYLNLGGCLRSRTAITIF